MCLYFCGTERPRERCPLVEAGYHDEADWRRRLNAKQEQYDLEREIARSGLPEWKVRAMRGRPT